MTMFNLTTLFAKGGVVPVGSAHQVSKGQLCSKELREMFADLLDEKGAPGRDG